MSDKSQQPNAKPTMATDYLPVEIQTKHSGNCAIPELKTLTGAMFEAAGGKDIFTVDNNYRTKIKYPITCTRMHALAHLYVYTHKKFILCR